MKRVSWKLFVAFLPLAFFALFVLFAARSVSFSASQVVYGAPILAMHFLVLSVFGLVNPLSAQARASKVYFLWCFALIAILPFSFMKASFGVGDVSSILMTMEENRLTEMVSVGFDGFTEEFWGTLTKMVGLIIAGNLVIKHVPLGRISVLALAVLLVVGNPISLFALRIVAPHPDQALIAADISGLEPNFEKTPEVQKNLVIVYLESLERTYGELSATEEAFSQLAKFEKAGHAFSNLHQLKSTFFTAGGLVASQCGVPLLPRGVFNPRRRISDKIDVIPEEENFLMGVTCLGDVLSERGYNASYINGSSLSIFSKGAFFRSHGFERVKGLESYPGYENEMRTNVWGMDDDLLFERLEDELRWLSNQDQPFLLTTLTLATHGPSGYLDDGCKPLNEAEVPLVSAIRCSGAHVSALIDEIKNLGLINNTIIVLVSDHLAFKNTFYAELWEVSDQRRNYAVILGDQAATIERDGTLLDLYPTILESLGFEIEGDRAGLGRSLLGKSPTLIETHGVDRVNRAIDNNMRLQRAIWSEAPAG